jgi:hypothetical protein
MKVDLYEKIWMYGTGVMLALFFASLANGAVRQGHHPPSHVETIGSGPRACGSTSRAGFMPGSWASCSCGFPPK